MFYIRSTNILMSSHPYVIDKKSSKLNPEKVLSLAERYIKQQKKGISPMKKLKKEKKKKIQKKKNQTSKPQQSSDKSNNVVKESSNGLNFLNININIFTIYTNFYIQTKHLTNHSNTIVETFTGRMKIKMVI